MADKFSRISEVNKQWLIEHYLELEFVDDDANRFRCNSCRRVAIDPYISKCNHLFCSQCQRNTELGNKSGCPVCHSPNVQMMRPDTEAGNQVNQLWINCPNKQYGCRNVSTLLEIPAHFKMCRSTKESIFPSKNKNDPNLKTVELQLMDQNERMEKKINQLNEKLKSVETVVNMNVNKLQQSDTNQFAIMKDIKKLNEEHIKFTNKMAQLSNSIKQIEDVLTGLVTLQKGQGEDYRQQKMLLEQTRQDVHMQQMNTSQLNSTINTRLMEQSAEIRHVKKTMETFAEMANNEVPKIKHELTELRSTTHTQINNVVVSVAKLEDDLKLMTSTKTTMEKEIQVLKSDLSRQEKKYNSLKKKFKQMQNNGSDSTPKTAKSNAALNEAEQFEDKSLETKTVETAIEVTNTSTSLDKSSTIEGNTDKPITSQSEERQETGRQFIKDPSEDDTQNIPISLTANKTYHVLLLGQTGVGKSTFINAFVNYLTYNDLDDATNSNLKCLIPCQFCICDNFSKIQIVKSDDSNTCENPTREGQSATQGCKTHPFQMHNFILKIIDTPGIGDTRGIEQDKKNLNHIFDYVSQYDELHAICILLKPNESRLTTTFEFCIKQLLCHLQKDANKNIIFVFTNSRSTFYGPGDTVEPLQKFLNSVTKASPCVEIPFDESNTFCLDNEAFRFLVALKNGITFSDDSRRDYGQSWLKSVKESQRMINYIVKGFDGNGITPHKVKDTISVHKALRAIDQLSRPLADVLLVLQGIIKTHNQNEKQSEKYKGAKNIEKKPKKQKLKARECLKQEQDIIKWISKLAIFLNQNALVVTNDAFKECLLQLIANGKSLNSKGSNNKEVIKGLEQMLKNYETEINSLEDFLKSSNNQEIISPEDVFAIIEKLYALEDKKEV